MDFTRSTLLSVFSKSMPSLLCCPCPHLSTMADPVFQFNASSLANTFFQRDALPAEVAQVLKQLAPSSFADTAALAAVGLVSSAFLLRRYTWDKPDPNEHIFYERPQAKEGFLNKVKTTRNIAERLEELVSQSETPRGVTPVLTRTLTRIKMQSSSGVLNLARQRASPTVSRGNCTNG